MKLLKNDKCLPANQEAFVVLVERLVGDGRFCDRFRVGLGCRGFSGSFFLSFGQNLDLHVRGDFAVQLDGHAEVAHGS